MALRITRLLATIFMIAMNSLAVTLPLNGMSTGALSDLLYTVITPAGFTFSIWSVIYIGLIGLTIAVVSKKIQLPDRAMVWYIVSALANGLRIFARHYQSLHLSMIIMFILLMSLIMLDRTLIKNATTIAYYQRVRGTVLLYLGRVLIATLLITLIYAKYQLNIISTYEVQIGMGIIILAWCTNLLIICREKNIITSLIAIWALYGIMSGQNDPQIILTAQIVIVILALGIAYHEGKKYMKTTPMPEINPGNRF